MISRRQIVAALGAGILAPTASLAQQSGKVWRIGFLSFRMAPVEVSTDPICKGFVDGMRDLGYVEGKNLVIEWRFGEGKSDRLREFAAELARIKVDVIMTHAEGTGAARDATSLIPIVSAVLNDPVGAGYAASLARPGGNITGLSAYPENFVAKILELLLIAAPKSSRVAVLTNPITPNQTAHLKTVQSAAQILKVTIVPVKVSSPQEITQAFTNMVRERINALLILPDGFYLPHVGRIADLAIKHRIPSIWGGRQYPDAGGLMSYGLGAATDSYRRAAIHVDKILKGAKPGELPIEQPTRFHMVINGKTAKVLGIPLSQELLLRADEVIE